MVWKSAYERAVEMYAEGERLRQERLAANYQPPPDPYAAPEFRYIGGSRAMTGQDAPRHKTPYEIEYERLAESDRRHLDRANGVPRPLEEPGETAKRLAAMMYDPNKPQPKPQRDPRIPESVYRLVEQVMPPEPAPAPRTYRLNKPPPPADFSEFDTDGQE